MISFIKGLLFDETRFIGLMRGLLLAAGTATATGMFAEYSIPQWAGVLLAGAGGFVRSSTHKSVPVQK